MRYGNPSIRAALRELAGKGCRRLLVLPLYPQYAAVTTGSTVDAVAAELMTWRWVPEIRTIHHYHDDPAYIRALAASIREAWERRGAAGEAPLLLPWHPAALFPVGRSLLLRVPQARPPCRGGAAACPLKRWRGLFPVALRQGGVAEALHRQDHHGPRPGRPPGSSTWSAPASPPTAWRRSRRSTSRTAKSSCTPGASAIGYIPALNDRPDHIRVIADLVHRNLQGWVEPAGQWSEEKALQASAESRRRAEAMKAARG